MMRSSARVGAAALVVASLLSACSSSSAKPAAATSTKPTSVARAAPRSFSELATRIVTKVPSGFVQQPFNVGDTGPSDLAKAIRDDGSPDAGKVLRAEGFVRGYQQLWVGPDNAEIIVFVYQFKSRAGARQDYARAARGSEAKPPPGAYKFVLKNLPADQAIGGAQVGRDAAGAFIFFTTGVFSGEIDCNGPRDKRLLKTLQARATSIAEDQFSRL